MFVLDNLLFKVVEQSVLRIFLLFVTFIAFLLFRAQLRLRQALSIYQLILHYSLVYRLIQEAGYIHHQAIAGWLRLISQLHRT